MTRCSHSAPADISSCFEQVRKELRAVAPTLFSSIPHSSHVRGLWRLFERGDMPTDHPDYAFFVFLARVWNSRGNEGIDRVTLSEAESHGVMVLLHNGWLELRSGCADETNMLRERRMNPSLARIFELTAGPLASFN